MTTWRSSNNSFGLLVATCLAAFLGPAPPNSLHAREPFLPFLRALQSSGYGEEALEYIERIAVRSDLPVDLKVALDVERSKSLRIAADSAYNAEQRRNLFAESKALLEKAQRENPANPALGTAMIAWGDEALGDGQKSLGAFRAVREKAEQDKYIAEARGKFAEARKHFADSQTRLSASLALIAKGAVETRQDIELGLLEARFKLALVDYLQAQSRVDAKDPDRKRLLEAAGKGFDAIFQEYRGRRIGFEAHLWHGKTLEDLGDIQTALDVYDEVLVVAPEGNDARLEDAPLFGQAALFRLRLLARTKKPQEAIAEGEEWLKTHRKWTSTRAYQGIALDVVKAKLAAADATKGIEKTKLTNEAILNLLAISKVESEFKQEAILLRRDLVEKKGTSEGALTANESLATGDDAAQKKNWTAAAESYAKTIELARAGKDDKAAETARQRLGEVRYRVALAHFADGKLEEAFQQAGQIVKDRPADPVAENASGLAVAAALAMYSSATVDSREAALERLDRVAAYTIKTWPDKAVADDARMAQAQAKLLKGESDAALKLLGEVKSPSNRYATAQQVAGQISWKHYLEGRKAPDASQRAVELARYREAARGHLETDLERQRAEQPASVTKLPQPQFETQLLLAEVMLEAGDFVKAGELFMPLVQNVRAEKTSKIEPATLRVFVGAVRAQLAAGAVDKAGEAALALVDISEDTPTGNAVVVDLSKLLVGELKRAEAADTDTQTLPAHQARVNNCKQVLGQMLDKLTARNQHSLPNLIYLGDTCAMLAMRTQARDVYQRVTKLIEKDDSAKASAGNAVARVRAQLIGLLRSEGKFEEANRQVDELIKANPSALEPLMEKGRILQDWSQIDAKRLDDCIAHWTKVRVLLGRIKTRPPEYYEALYNAATCLVRESARSKDKEKGLQAEQMLKSTLTLSPKLSGPDMVAKYEALLKGAAKVQGKGQ